MKDGGGWGAPDPKCFTGSTSALSVGTGEINFVEKY